MSKPRQLIGFSIAVFCLTLIALAPARLADPLIKQASAGHLSLHASSGSLWHGNGQLQLSNHAGQHFSLGQISWEIGPAALLGGQLEIALIQILGDQRGAAQLKLGVTQMTLLDLHLHLPAEAIASLSPMLSALSPAGKLQLQSASYTLRREAAQLLHQGQITAFWQPATFLNGVEAGNYRIQLNGNNSAVLAGELSTLSGKLDLQGKLQINERQQLIMNGKVHLAPGPQAQRLMPVFRALCGQGKDSCTLGSGLL
ncbi:MAG: type II secretion system protein N [Rhodocyclaceae bacterium]|nr:type II secretion system protein N [Rhodocyclaceae bacterium]